MGGTFQQVPLFLFESYYLCNARTFNHIWLL
nr:MAG TPA: hypothetical protein [Caudoviricetes sp.]DAR52390.1 MAG TPA: hypothetical protein [Caudoviricetes sp.]